MREKTRVVTIVRPELTEQENRVKERRKVSKKLVKAAQGLTPGLAGLDIDMVMPELPTHLLAPVGSSVDVYAEALNGMLLEIQEEIEEDEEMAAFQAFLEFIGED